VPALDRIELAIRQRFHSDCALGDRLPSTFPMKRTLAIVPIVALAIGFVAQFSLNAEEESAEARKARYDQLAKQISAYYKVKSPWKSPDDFELEATLWHLMGAELDVWQLEDSLKGRNDVDIAKLQNVGMLLHEEILGTAEKALRRFRARPNPRLLDLLIAHLEAYPGSWTQEGNEDLLPNLKKLQNTRKDGAPRSGGS
jgi:hypothetical protein